MKLQQLLSYTRKAVDDYQMIQPGDKIAIGISGGKDSLALLYALAGLRRFYPNPFELCAITVDLGFEGFDLSEIIELANSMDYLPLTDNQIGVYYECMQSPGEVKYTMPTTMRLGSDVDADKLKEAVIEAVEAHPYLKTRIVIDDDGELKQKRCDDIAIDEIEIAEVDSISDEEMIENLAEYVASVDKENSIEVLLSTKSQKIQVILMIF